MNSRIGRLCPLRPAAASDSACAAAGLVTDPDGLVPIGASKECVRLLTVPATGAADRSASQVSARSHWVDAARGIGIVLMVYAHAVRGLTAADLYPTTPWTMLQDRLIYAFHMPLFFLLAGLWVERSLAAGRRRFMVKTLLFVAWPYLLWSEVEGLAAVALAPATNHGMAADALLRVAFEPIHHFWFLYALFLLHLAAAATGVRLWAMALLTVALLLLHPSGPLTMLTVAAEHAPYYLLGIALARLRGPAALAELPNKWLLTFAAWAIFAALFFISGADQRLPSLYLRVPLAIAGIAGVIGAAMLADRVRPLVILGTASMAIFVLHILFGSGLRILLRELDLLPDPNVLLLAVTLVGLILPLLARALCLRLGILAWAGLGRPLGDTMPARAG